VACGGQVSFAVSQRGDAWSWGRNEESGVLGQGEMPVACVPAPVPVLGLRRKLRAAQVATTGWTALCVSHLGALFSWGGGACGVHGQGHQDDESSAKAVRGLDGVAVVQAAAGALHALALSARGEVFTWGRIVGAFGAEAQLQLVPKFVDALLDIRIVQVAAGAEHSLALAADGEVYAWGSRTAGALGSGHSNTVPQQQHLLVHKADLGVGRVRELACGRSHSLFLAEAEGEEEEKAGGDLWICGMGAAASPHVASKVEGVPVTRAGEWGKALAAPIGVPLKLQKVDVKRVLAMFG